MLIKDEFKSIRIAVTYRSRRGLISNKRKKEILDSVKDFMLQIKFSDEDGTEYQEEPMVEFIKKIKEELK